MILLPNATGTTHVQWVAVGEATHHECLDDDNAATSYVKCSADSRIMTIEYADPSLVTIAFNAPTAGFGEGASYDAHRTNFETINGTARTTSDGSSAWTYSDLENLEMKCTKVITVEVYLSYLALEVTYTEAGADNAVFFGCNF